MKVCITNFWDGAFDGDFFEFLFKTAWGDFDYTLNHHEADIVITSVYHGVQTDPAKTICYIGENVRPSYIGYNYSMSFDYDTYGGRNFRLPLWYSRLAWPGFTQSPRKPNLHNHGYEQPIPINQLLYPRKLDMQQKKEFCALIAGNPEGLRINLFHSISKYKQVHGYGNMFNAALRKSKFEILPEYKFCLCPENSIYDGYVTEKLIDAYAGGCVPIYSGDRSVDEDFNGYAYINYMDKRNMDFTVSWVHQMDTDDLLYQTIYEQPLLTKEPSLNDAIAFLHNVKTRIMK